MSIYDEILDIVEEELPGIGEYMLRKQLDDLGIDKASITAEDVPRISKSLAEASAMFGRDKSRRLAKRIEGISGVENAIRSEKDPSKKLSMLMDVAATKYRIGEMDEALATYGEALEIAEDSGFPRHVAEIKRGIGNIKLRKSDFKGAEEDFLEAYRISEKIFDKKGIVLAESDLGSLEWKRGKYKKAIKRLDNARRMAADLRDRDLEGKAYMSLANVYDEMGDPEKGIMYSKMALRSLERAGNEKGVVTIYNNIGVAYARMGDMNGDKDAYLKSKEYYEKCISLARKLDYMMMEGWASFNLAETLAKIGDFEEALDYAGRSEEIFRRMNDDLGMSGALMSFAVIYREKGDFEESDRYFQETIAIRRRLKTPYRIADALYEHGLLLKEMNDPRSRAVLSEAASIFEDIGNSERAKDAREAI